MITFKQFIAEIDHDDSVYSKKASHHVLANHKLDASWAPLMTADGYEFVWKEVGPEYRVIMKDEHGAAMLRLELRARSAKVPGGNLMGVVTDSLSSHEKIRGTGMALKMYKALVEHGQVLFSSNMQTSGSRKLWEQLVQSNAGTTFVLAEGAAARFYMRKAGRDDELVSNVLLTGSLDRLNDEAYASSETRWVIVPGDVTALKKAAINLSGVQEEKHVPEWEKPCWIVAINKTLGTPESKIKALAKKAGWDGKTFGAPVHTAIQVAWDLIGKMPDLSQTKASKGMTAREYSGKTNLTGMVFTSKHVMPMVNGKLSNFNGHGDEQIIAVATYEKP